MRGGTAMRRLILCGLVCLMVGCAGPKVGDSVLIHGGKEAVLYLDEGLYRTAAQHDRGSRDALTSVRNRIEGQWQLLSGGSYVRIVSAEPTGFKVEVVRGAMGRTFDAEPPEDPSLKGKTGWILREDIEKQEE
jgi:hypothetical protein